MNVCYRVTLTQYERNELRAERLTPAIRFSWWSVPQDKEARMNVRYRVTLTQYERNELRALLNGVRARRESSSGPRSCWLQTLASAMRTSP
jgi:hypothetical protein